MEYRINSLKELKQILKIDPGGEIIVYWGRAVLKFYPVKRTEEYHTNVVKKAYIENGTDEYREKRELYMRSMYFPQYSFDYSKYRKKVMAKLNKFREKDFEYTI